MRLVTKGSPADVLQKIGQAKNLMSRQLEKMRVTGQTTGRVRHDGIDLRLDKHGVNQMKIDAPAQAKEPDRPEEESLDDVVVYHCLSKKLGAISAYSYDDIATKSLRYFGTEPATDYTELLDYQAIVIYEPTRILSSKELLILKKLLAGGVKVFLFPGDITIYNALLAQFGSGLYIKPFSSTTFGGIRFVSPDTNQIYLLPVYDKGYIAVKLDSYAPLVTDPFGKGLIYENIISASYVYAILMSGFSYDYLFGAYLDTLLLLSWNRNTEYTLTEYPYDWRTLTKAELKAWTATLGAGIIKTVQSGEACDLDHIANFTPVSSYLAYAAGSNLYVSGVSPYWLRPQNTGEYDKNTDTDKFCAWMGTGKQVKKSKSRLGNFTVLPPYFWQADGIGPVIQT